MISLELLFRQIRFVAKRLERGRRGSVLLLIVVLLVLLALVGATYLSTSRQSRVMSAQNVQSTDLDVMIDGICQACQGVIVDDLNDNAGNLKGNIASSSGTNQGVHGVYRGPYQLNQAYSVGDIVSYVTPKSPPTPVPPPPNFFVAVAAVKASPGNAPALGITTPWLQTSHVPGVTSSLIQPWLADRIPTPEGVTGTPLTLAYWPNISQMAVPAGGSSPTSIMGTPFESPDGTAMPHVSPGLTLVGQLGATLVPDFKPLDSGVTVPALDYPYPGTQLVAGDADGDGIADSLFFRIPGANMDGLTWYAAVRIIDNNSAINLNTALSRDSEYTLSSGSLVSAGLNSNYYSLFQTSVGLYELLNHNDIFANFAAFNAYRVGAGVSQTPQADASPGGANPLLPVTRPDFQFLSAGDSLYQQLIRRIGNPGFNGNGSANTRFQALPMSDQAALAYRFCLVNPESAVSQDASSVSETLLPYSLARFTSTTGVSTSYRSTPYSNDGSPSSSTVNEWFNDNFDFDNLAADYGNQPQPVRSLVVTRNPVSNAIEPVYDSNASNPGEPLDPLGAPGYPYAQPAPNVIPGMMLPYGTAPQSYTHYRGKFDPSAKYQFNDIVEGGDGRTYTYVYIPGNGVAAPTTGQLVAPTLQNLLPAPPDPTHLPPPPYDKGLGLYAFWQYQPWTTSPVKANANTATFRELYRAFWSVMAGNPSNETPFGNTQPAAPPAPPYNPYNYTSNPQHQFRSPLRDPTYTSASTSVTYLDPENTMLLRAALAAVNTLGLRDASQNVISRTVYLNAMISGSSSTVMARVYSNAPQPVISEVFASSYSGWESGSESASGYVAVEAL